MNHGKSLLGLAGVGLAVCALSAFAFAAASGRVTIVAGAAEVLRSGELFPLEKDDVVQTGDALRTRVDGRLQWWMEDDSLVAMATRSQTVLRRFEPSAGQALYDLDTGGLRILSAAVNPKIQSPVATISSRGPDIVMFVCDNPCEDDNAPVQTGKRLYVLVESGSALVQNAAGSREALGGQVVLVASVNSAPVLIPQAPRILLQARAELKFEYHGEPGTIPGVPIQPLPPVELPGSPS